MIYKLVPVTSSTLVFFDFDEVIVVRAFVWTFNKAKWPAPRKVFLEFTTMDFIQGQYF